MLIKADGTKGRITDSGWILILCVVAFSVRMFWIEHPKLWHDEVFSYVYARHSFAHHFDLHRTSDVHPPLHSVMLKIFIAWFGDSRLAMRSLSAIFGALTVPAIYLIARNWLSIRVAVIAAVFLAINPVNVHFSREARAYAALSFCLLWATYFYLELLRNSRAPRRVLMCNVGGFAVFLALTFYLHYTAILFFVLFGIVSVLLVLVDHDRRKFSLLAAGLAIATLLCIPQSIHMVGYSMQAGAARNNWIEATNFRVFYTNTAGAYPFALFAKPAMLAIYLYGSVRLFRQAKPLFFVAMTFIVIGPLLFAAIGFVKPIYLVRSIQGLVLLSPLLIAIAISGLPARWLVPTMMLLGAVHVWAFKDDYPKLRQINPGEAVKSAQGTENVGRLFFDSGLDSEQDPEFAAYKVSRKNSQALDLKQPERGGAEIRRYFESCVGRPCRSTMVVIENDPLFLKIEGAKWRAQLDQLKTQYPVISDRIVANYRIIQFR